MIQIGGDALVLTAPPEQPSCGGAIRYALGFAFQADATTAGFMLMRMIEDGQNYGYLDGSDVVLIDDPSRFDASKTFPLSRNELVADQPRLFMKSPMIGGFVPRGALRADGTPHPHAGSGFGIAQAHWFTFVDQRFRWWDEQRKDMTEVYQLSYDGRSVVARRSGVWTQSDENPLPIGDGGWSIFVSGICTAIPDADDLLHPAMACKDGDVGVGVVRWRCSAGVWRPEVFDPVDVAQALSFTVGNRMEQCPWMEPTMARGADGRVLFAARGRDSFDGKGTRSGFRVRVWRSDAAERWRAIVDQPDIRMNSPVSINVAADGSPYVASNPYDPRYVPETAETGRGREKLVIWPLSSSRDGLEAPLRVRDCLEDFGSPPGSATRAEKWMADHPNGVTVRLRDGRRHHLLAYRVCHSPPYRPSGVTPSCRSGCYIHEVFGVGSTVPIWRFGND